MGATPAVMLVPRHPRRHGQHADWLEGSCGVERRLRFCSYARRTLPQGARVTKCETCETVSHTSCWSPWNPLRRETCETDMIKVFCYFS